MTAIVAKSRRRGPKPKPPPPPLAAAPEAVEPPGPGRVLPSHRVLVRHGALPREYGTLTPAVVTSLGPKHTGVRVHGEAIVRRVRNELVELDDGRKLAAAWPADPRDAPHPYGGRHTHPWTYRWLPRWSWIGWSVAEHHEYARGERPLEPAPVGLRVKRLVIVGCGGKKRNVRHLDAHGMYVGSYHLSARRAADALVARDGSQLILSALYGLLDLHDVISPYDLRMGDAGSVTVEQVRYQAEQLGLLDAEEVIVLAGRAYADVVSAVWPHALRPLDGTAGIGEQLHRLAAIRATGTLPEPKEPIVSVFARPPVPSDVYPAELRAGDVIEVPDRGELTLADGGRTLSSNKPTWVRFNVVGGTPFDVDASGTTKVRLIGVGAITERPKPAAARKTTRAGRKPAAVKRQVPIEEVTWGMYGEIDAMGPDGSRTKQTGYVIKVPRVFTGGLMEKPKLKGKPVWHFDMNDPGRVYWIGMNALPGTMFTVLDPPADRPLTFKPSDSRRMPVRDTRAGDVVTVTVPVEGRTWRDNGPAVLLTEDPKPLGGGHVELAGLVDGKPETHQMPEFEWVDVKGPAVQHLLDQEPADPAPAAEQAVEEQTAEPEPQQDEVQPGATIRCPACGQNRKVTKARKIPRHGRGPGCEMGGKAVPPGVTVVKPPAAEPEPLPFDMDAMAAFFGQIGEQMAELEPRASRVPCPPCGGSGAADRQQCAGCGGAGEVTPEKAERLTKAVKSPEERLLEKVAARLPADVIEWSAGDGDDHPRVLARYVANGVYVEATGVDEKWQPVTAEGYVVEAHPLSGGYGGKAPEYMTLLMLADDITAKPTDPGVRMVQVEPGGRVTALWGPHGKHQGVGYPWLRMPVEQQILAAREQLGLAVRVYDGPANELWEVEGCPEKLTGEVASWLFEGKCHSWEGRPEPRFEARHIAAAIRDDRYRPRRSRTLMPSTLVQPVTIPDGLTEAEGKKEYARLIAEGKLVDGSGAPLRAVDCWLCTVRRPHQITSGLTCPYEIDCPTCKAGPNKPCMRPSEHRVWGGLHDSRTKLALEVDDARAVAGDLTVPALWPGSKGLAAQQTAVKAAEEALIEDVAELARQAGWIAKPERWNGSLNFSVHQHGDGPSTFCTPEAAKRLLIRIARRDAVAAVGPVNAGPVLDELLAKADTPEYGRYGRQKAREHAERYAAGLPLVRHKRQLDQQWTLNCPVPSCLTILAGHDTIREARAAWFAHAEQHEGFVPTWPDDLLPEEPEQEAAQVKRVRKGAKKRQGPPPAVIEITEPVSNDWWDDSALAWERCGLLHRYELTGTDAGQSVAVLSIPQGYSAAVQFKELLATIGGVDRDAMIVHVLTPEEAQADQERRDQVEVESRARAFAAVHGEAAPAQTPVPGVEVEELTLFDFDMEGISAAVEEAVAALT